MSDAVSLFSKLHIQSEAPNIPPVHISDHLRVCSAKFGLLEIAERISRGQNLAPEEALLLPQAPLFLLSSLVQLAGEARSLRYFSLNSDFPDAAARPAVQPVYLLPLGKWLEEARWKDVLARAESALRQVDRELTLQVPLSLALDRWHGPFKRADLLQLTSKLLEVNGLFHPVRFVGPSTAELREMFSADQLSSSNQAAESLHEMLDKVPAEGENEWYAQLFQELKSHHLHAIDGGTDFELHALAAAHNLTVAVGHDISSFIEAAVYTPVAANYQEENFFRVIEERFIQELLDIQTRICGTGYMRTWFPWFRSALRKFHRTGDQAFGAPLLRMIAFARLVLADTTYVRAPLSLFGKHFVQCAHLFGANDVGYAAVESQTAEILGIPRLSDVITLIGNERLYSEFMS